MAVYLEFAPLIPKREGLLLPTWCLILVLQPLIIPLQLQMLYRIFCHIIEQQLLIIRGLPQSRFSQMRGFSSLTRSHINRPIEQSKLSGMRSGVMSRIALPYFQTSVANSSDGQFLAVLRQLPTG